MTYQMPLSNNNDIFWIRRLTLMSLSLHTIYMDAYTGQVPGDFLGRLRYSLLPHRYLLSHASTSMAHHNAETCEHELSDRTF